jgi:hypothetical protein
LAVGKALGCWRSYSFLLCDEEDKRYNLIRLTSHVVID